MEEGKSAFKILTGKHIGQRPLGRPRRRWEDNIRMYRKEIGVGTRNWVDLTPAIVTTCLDTVPHWPRWAIHKLRHTLRGGGG